MAYMELTNFTVWGRDWFPVGWEGLRAFCESHGLSGVELLASGATPETAPPAELVHGIHLRSLGSWLPLAGVPVVGFGECSPRYREAGTYGALVARRAAELREVAALQPQYAIWHGNYATRESVLGGGNALTDEQFLQSLADLVRDVLGEYTPPFTICFENALGAGVRPDAVEATAVFFRELAGLPVGMALDIGHHLNSHREIADVEAGCRELGRVGEELRRHGVGVEVLHLHWTPPQVVPATLPETHTPGPFFELADQHHPLAHRSLAEGVAAVAPKYVVHEMGATSLPQHASWLTQQTTALRAGSLGCVWRTR